MGETPYMLVLKVLTNNKEFLPFMQNKEIDGIRNLAEFVGDDENSSLKASDIQDFIKCVEFIKELKEYSNLLDKEFFDKFIELSLNNKYKNIEIYIQKVNQNFNEFKNYILKILINHNS